MLIPVPFLANFKDTKQDISARGDARKAGESSELSSFLAL